MWTLVLAFFLGVAFGAILMAMIAVLYVSSEAERFDQRWR